MEKSPIISASSSQLGTLRPGPIEQAIEGAMIKDRSLVEIVHIVRSFDPCVACAVHLITLKGRSLGEFRLI